ncbi:MAG: hypothetical protein KBF42_07345 [Chitinophagales bacterium]|nr:hypothetical protein [Chitinophagales bacterium]MBP9796670.1 hypothetical protein [Chitinophagales bacterium]
MRYFHSLILGSLCAFLNFSCSQNQNDLTSDDPVPPVLNYTLAAAESEDELPVFNSVRSQQINNKIYERLEGFAPVREEFKIDPQSLSVITCEKGTTVKFDPGIFVYADNKMPVSEDIIISVTEYLSTSDFLFKGLSTTSNNQLIETAGMVYLDASAGGRIVEIKAGEYYNIEIPSSTEKENMELFYGKETEDGINWVSANRGNLMFYDDRNYNLCGYYKKGKKVKTQFDGGIGALYEYLHSQYVFPDGFDEASSKKEIILNATSYVNFSVNSEGQPIKVYTSPYIRTYADSQLVVAFQNSPCWITSVNIYEAKKMMIPVKMNWVRDPKKIPTKLLVNDKPEEKKFTASYEADRYLMVSAQLGWINCDRFTDPQIPKTNLFVVLDSTYDATVRIVFNDISSVMTGKRFTGGFEFQNLPGGQYATIVAMRIVDGKTEIATKKYLINGSTVNDLVFKVADENELRRQFESIGKNEELALSSGQ